MGDQEPEEEVLKSDSKPTDGKSASGDMDASGEHTEEADPNDDEDNDSVSGSDDSSSDDGKSECVPTWLKVVAAVVAVPSMIWGGWYWWKSRQVDSTCTKILKAVGILRRRRLKKTSAQRTLGRLLDAMHTEFLVNDIVS